MLISRLEIAYPYLFARVLFFDILLVTDLIVVAASLFLYVRSVLFLRKLRKEGNDEEITGEDAVSILSQNTNIRDLDIWTGTGRRIIEENGSIVFPKQLLRERTRGALFEVVFSLSCAVQKEEGRAIWERYYIVRKGFALLTIIILSTGAILEAWTGLTVILSVAAVQISLFLLYSLIPARMLKRTEEQALMLVRFYGLCTEEEIPECKLACRCLFLKNILAKF